MQTQAAMLPLGTGGRPPCHASLDGITPAARVQLVT